MLNHCVSELFESSDILIGLSNKQVSPDAVTTKPKALSLASCLLLPSLVFFFFKEAPSLHHVIASSSTDLLAHSISLGFFGTLVMTA